MSLYNHSEKELIIQLQGGCQDHLSSIIDRHESKVFLFARFLSNDETNEAEIILQKTFDTLIRNSDLLSCDCSLIANLCRIAISTVSLQIKDDVDCLAKRVSVISEQEPNLPWYSQSSLTTPPDMHNELHLAIRSLSPTNRIFFVLRYVLHLNHKEIAFVMDLPPLVAVEETRRARTIIKERLGRKIRIADIIKPANKSIGKWNLYRTGK